MDTSALLPRDTRDLSPSELRDEIDRLNFFISATMDLAFEWDLATDDVFVSKNLATILGADSQTIPYKQLLDAIHPDHRSHYQDAVRSHFNQDRRRVVIEYQIREHDGDYRWVAENGIAMRDQDEKPVRYVASFKDISPRKMAEAEFLDSNARLQAIMENTSSPISLKDTDGRYVLVNDIFCVKRGLKRHEVIGKTAHELYDKTFAEEVTGPDIAVIETGKPVHTEISSVEADNEMHTFISDRFPIFAADGTLIGIGSLDTDITERKKMEAALRKSEKEMRLLAATDPLTGARNRRSFFEIGNSELARSNRYKRSLSLLMMDIDHFKNFNDTYGHATGDVILKNFATECLRTLREQDTLGRLGGEEFGVILPEIDLETAEVIAERLRQNLMDLETVLDGKSLKFTVSIGVGQCNWEDATIDRALNEADNALYRAKQSGRNRVEK